MQDEALIARHPKVIAQLRSKAGCDFRLAVNGVDVPQEGKPSPDGVYTYNVPAAYIKCGENHFTVSPVVGKSVQERIALEDFAVAVRIPALP